MRRSLSLVGGLLACGSLFSVACSNGTPQQGRAVPYGPAACAPCQTPAGPSTAYRAPMPSTTYRSPAPATAYMPPPPPPPPAPAPSYTPTYPAPSYQPAATAPRNVSVAAPAPAPARAYSTGWRWHTRLAEAQADARAQGKLILLASTKPGCGLCEKFKETVVPQSMGQLETMAVGYVFNILAPEDPRADQVLRSNLPGASLMPLVGFVTPDLQWVHGFWGPTDANKFAADMATARRIYPVHAMFVSPSRAESKPVAMVNEYGEYEWSTADEVVPEDAIGPQDEAKPATPVVAAAPAPEPAPVPEETIAPPPAPVVAVAPAPEPTPAPAVEPAVAPAPAPAAPYTAPSSDMTASVVWSPPATPDSIQPAGAKPEGAKPEAAKPEAPKADAPAVTPEWGESMLQKALEQIRAGDLDAARTTLGDVIARLPGSDLGLEASRGTVAIHDMRKMQAAAQSDRTALAEKARRDLTDSRWTSLFE